jgi:hypothetical protein
MYNQIVGGGKAKYRAFDNIAQDWGPEMGGQ